MRAALYARVSTAEQVEGFSLDAQLRELRDHCRALGWTIAGEFVDEGVSAARESAAQRPQFRALLAEVEARRVDVVAVHKLDRFSRNLVVTLQSLARIDAAGAAFVSLSEQIDYTTPQGRLILSMFGAFAAFYSDNLGHEVAKGRKERALQGLWNGDLPFGYISTGDARRAPVVVESEAELVREAFKRYAAGTWAAHEVAVWLNEQGAKPRSKRGLTRFTKATVMDMLANPFYTGQVRYRGEVLAGAHAAIVEPELFEHVAAAKVKRRRLGQAVRTTTTRTYLLRGMARCVSCGRVLWCSPGASGRRYRDASRDKQQTCLAHAGSVDAPVVEEQVGQMIRRMILPPNWRERVLSIMSETMDGQDAKARRAAIRDRLSRLRELYLDGDMPRVRYDAERSRLKAELDTLAAAVIAPAEESGELLRRLAEAWDEATEEERASMAADLFEEVYLDLDAKVVHSVRPRARFAPLFDVLRAERVLLGDPERPRVDQAALYAPVIELLASGSLYRPEELAS